MREETQQGGRGDNDDSSGGVEHGKDRRRADIPLRLRSRNRDESESIEIGNSSQGPAGIRVGGFEKISNERESLRSWIRWTCKGTQVPRWSVDGRECCVMRYLQFWTDDVFVCEDVVQGLCVSEIEGEEDTWIGDLGNERRLQNLNKIGR